MKIALKKYCNVQQDDWDQRILAVSWVYRTTHKRLTCHTPFRLVYGKDTVMPMELIVSSLSVASITNLMEENVIQKHLQELMELERGRFIVGFHQKVEKE